MKPNHYFVVLTNGTTQQEYGMTAMNATQAIILAQAKAINLGRGYDFVSCIEKPE